MGIEGFSKLIQSRYPKCCSTERPDYFDVVYVDMPQLIAPLLRQDQRNFTMTGEALPKFYKRLFRQLSLVLSTFKSRIVYLSVDGLPPLAKSTECRARIVDRILKNADTVQTFERYLPDHPDNYTKRILEYVERKNPGKRTEFYVDGNENPGESEHKFLAFIRNKIANNELRHGFKGLIVSNDNDLFVLALTLHEPNLWKSMVPVHGGGDPLVFSIGELRKCIAEEYDRCERGIDDFVGLTFLTGNDFLPQIMTMTSAENLYRKAKAENSKEWLINNGELNMGFFKKMLAFSANEEKPQFWFGNKEDALGILAGLDWMAKLYWKGVPSWRWIYSGTYSRKITAAELLACIDEYRCPFVRDEPLPSIAVHIYENANRRSRNGVPDAIYAIADDPRYSQYFTLDRNGKMGIVPLSAEVVLEMMDVVMQTLPEKFHVLKSDMTVTRIRKHQDRKEEDKIGAWPGIETAVSPKKRFPAYHSKDEMVIVRADGRQYIGRIIAVKPDGTYDIETSVISIPSCHDIIKKDEGLWEEHPVSQCFLGMSKRTDDGSFVTKDPKESDIPVTYSLAAESIQRLAERATEIKIEKGVVHESVPPSDFRSVARAGRNIGFISDLTHINVGHVYVSTHPNSFGQVGYVVGYNNTPGTPKATREIYFVACNPSSSGTDFGGILPQPSGFVLNSGCVTEIYAKLLPQVSRTEPEPEPVVEATEPQSEPEVSYDELEAPVIVA